MKPNCLLAWLDSLRNQTVCWLDCGCMVLLCVSPLFASSLWKSCPARGWQWAKRLMSTLAYGWVKDCSNITSCKEASSQDKYFLYLTLQLYLFCKLSWTCWILECEWMYLLSLFNELYILMCTCIYFNAFYFICLGLDCPFDSINNSLVTSSLDS